MTCTIASLGVAIFKSLLTMEDFIEIKKKKPVVSVWEDKSKSFQKEMQGNSGLPCFKRRFGGAAGFCLHEQQRTKDEEQSCSKHAPLVLTYKHNNVTHMHLEPVGQWGRNIETLEVQLKESQEEGQLVKLHMGVPMFYNLDWLHCVWLLSFVNVCM